MNKTIYALVGACVAVVIVVALTQQAAADSSHGLAVIVFIVAMVAGGGFMLYSRSGKAMRSRVDDNVRQRDDRERESARSDGKVREQMPLPPP